MPDCTLVVLPVSPYSERARWALDYHRIAYRVVVHEPFVGERRLRRLVGPGPERATVPVLLEDDRRLLDSLDIARRADVVGTADKLFPADRDDELLRWVALADESTAAGRASVSASMLRHPGALDETLPPFVPSWVRPALRPVTSYGTRWFARKYGLDLDDTAKAEAGMRAGLDALRAGLATGATYLLGAFSYADVAMATLLQGVKPVEHPRYPIGPATRRAWTHAALSVDYADLLAWRDALYRRHRGA